MSFVSEGFLLFLLLLLAAYYLLPKRWQPYVLLAGSYVFYAFSGLRNLFYIAFTTLTTYFGARWIENYQKKRQDALLAMDSPSVEIKKAWKQNTSRTKHWIMTAVLIANFGVLAYVKYFSYLYSVVASFLVSRGAGSQGAAFSILLPMGISFFTFQALGYLIDVTRNKHAAEKNIFKYALFVSFFPQLIQGPISRFTQLGEQLYSEHPFEIKNIRHGLLLALWGYFKKMVVADHLAVFVGALFSSWAEQKGIQVFFSGVFYGIEIYADFSGGIDVARGVAMMLGIQVTQNFEQPFFAVSISDFWRRWHITLGAWMRDYVFYPLAMSKTFNNLGKWCKKHMNPDIGKLIPTCLIAIINFLLIGIWHGPNFKYVMYGLYNGLIVSVGTLIAPGISAFLKKKNISENSTVLRFLRILRTFILVTFGRIIAHADSWAVGKSMLAAMFTKSSAGADWIAWLKQGELTSSIWILMLIGIAVIFLRDIVVERGVNLYEKFDSLHIVWRVLILDAFILLILLFGVYGIAYNSSAFLYGGF